ncbi:MAG: hypothetical protein WCA15_21035, partial [Candidatus Acidiferrales bacterium]
MNFRNRFAVLVLVLTALGIARAQSPAAGSTPTVTSRSGKRPLTVDDYFRIKEVGDPQLSPDVKWVAYTVKTASLKDDKNYERIWMVPVSGGAAIPLTADELTSSHPRWSPDGKYLAFISARGGTGDDDDTDKKQVWLLNREGGEAQKLTDTIQDVQSFAWSPASDRMVLLLQDPSPDELEAARE